MDINRKNGKKNNFLDVLNGYKAKSHEQNLTWLRKGNIKRETESLLATQNNVILKQE